MPQPPPHPELPRKHRGKVQRLAFLIAVVLLIGYALDAAGFGPRKNQLENTQLTAQNAEPGP
jgi:hypothetical protein